VNQSSMLKATITDLSGSPINDLEPYMGAYAHLVGFTKNGEQMVHCHPVSDDYESRSGNLSFHITPEIQGPIKFFLQVKRHGEVLTLPFGQVVTPSLRYVDRIAAKPYSHTAIVMG
jgi:hypothetical protein